MIVKFSSILSCSSEHPSFPASNLLEYKPSKDSSTWLCATPGILESEVTFELSSPCPVTGVDLGNRRCCSVRVSGSPSSTDDEWITIVEHEFMSRNDAEDGHFKDQVQLFTKKEIGERICALVFARVRVTCFQPANLKVLFGLSFLILRTEDSEDSGNLDAFGRFKVKQKDDSLDRFKQKYLQQIRPRSDDFKTELAREIESKRSVGEEPTQRKRPSLASPEAETKRIKLQELNILGKLARGRARCSLCLGNEENVLCKTCNLLLPEKAAGASSPPSRPSPKKRKKQKKKPEKMFAALFEGVVFSLSGYENPERDEVRRKGIAMGARYIGGTNGCTHLICAFKNTPKYKLVKGRSKIVSHRWIEECYDKKTRFPWRRYALDSKDANGAESEEEIVASAAPAQPSIYDQDTDSDH